MTFKTVFSNEYQMSHFREPVYQILADTRLESDLTKGQTIARSFASDVQVNDMGGDGSYTTQAITDTQETLVINKEKEASIYIKKLDELQAHLPVKVKYGRKLANALINQIDGDVLLAAYQGAGTSLDDGSFAGTPGNGYVITASNVATAFVTAMQKLRLKNVVYNKRFQGGMKLEVPDGMPVAVISPEILSYIELYLGGKDTLLGDQVSRNGYSGYFMGFELFVSNSLAWTASLALATNPTADDTVTVNGVTWTFKANPASAGEIDIGADADATRILLQNAINGSSTGQNSATGYFEVSAANRRLLKNITATDNATPNTLTLVASGWGTVVVSETLTAAADVWTTGLQQLHVLFALSKSISLVIQKNPSLEENFVSGKIGRDYIAWTVYGIKVFTDQAPQIVTLAVNSSAFTAASATPK
jgi:hypothetical protein